jgi:hypothetical protein
LPWYESLDAALEWPGNHPSGHPTETVYFFKGKYFVEYNMVKGTSSAANRIGAKWPGLNTSGIDAAVSWPPTSSNGNKRKAYFFWGKEYCRYSVISRSSDKGYPKKIRDWPGPVELGIWAANDVAIIPCFDARYRGKSGGPKYPDGNIHGQGGWDMGFQFKDLDDLVMKLTTKETPDHVGGEKIMTGQIYRLAINAHGGPGYLAVKGVFAAQKDEESKDLIHRSRLDNYNLENDPYFRTKLLEIGKLLAKNATVFLMGCEAAQGEPGSNLLKKLSLIWPGVKVVGFITIGYEEGGFQARPNTSPVCNEVGMRETSETHPGGHARDPKYQEQWNDLKNFPWCSEFSKFAKIAYLGKVHFHSRVVEFRPGN